MDKARIAAMTFLLVTAMICVGCTEQMETHALGENISSNSDDAYSFNSYEDSLKSDDFTSSENLTSSENSAISESEPDLNALIDVFPKDSFTGPDGNTVSKYEANHAEHYENGVTHTLGFDFAYVRYAQPGFYNNLDNPELFDGKTLEFKGSRKSTTDSNYFMVKAGDKLENGLIVKSAKYQISSEDYVRTKVEFDGKLTLEGILFSYPSNYSPHFEQGFLEFFPDTSKYRLFPVLGTAHDNEDIWDRTDSENHFAFVGAESFIWFDNYKSFDQSNFVALGEYSKVRITIKDISIEYGMGIIGNVSATLVSIEKI